MTTTMVMTMTTTTDCALMLTEELSFLMRDGHPHPRQYLGSRNGHERLEASQSTMDSDAHSINPISALAATEIWKI